MTSMSAQPLSTEDAAATITLAYVEKSETVHYVTLDRAKWDAMDDDEKAEAVTYASLGTAGQINEWEATWDEVKSRP